MGEECSMQQRFGYFLFFWRKHCGSCCVKPFPVWVSCDSGQGTGIGTDRASELHENFPLSLTACALHALFACVLNTDVRIELACGSKCVCVYVLQCVVSDGAGFGGDAAEEEKG